ncbi:hypothetical protein MKW92_049626 [Papaver armeniacum]|nr:hypothetical protein MKW92_049626 [Papaver armeniacum]
MGSKKVLHSFIFFLLGLLFFSVESKSSTTEKDVTTPITTVSFNQPNESWNVYKSTCKSTFKSTRTYYDKSNRTTMTNQQVSMTNPNNPSTAASSSGGSWCLTSCTDYACGYGKADCSAIQTAGKCYNPNTLVIMHLTHSMNTTQKNPSSGACQYGSTR